MDPYHPVVKGDLKVNPSKRKRAEGLSSYRYSHIFKLWAPPTIQIDSYVHLHMVRISR